MKKIAFTIAVLLFAIGCKDTEVCDERFALIGLNVIGKELTNSFTVRKSNGDTLNKTTEAQGLYIVVDDNYRDQINGNEIFVFEGFIDNSRVVLEEFTVGTDDCHVIKISGVSEVKL
ncbi:MAG: hypothetical protein ACI8ZN_001111 [Bacteroidia bacterium]|jgi:hypothetical protein